MKEATENHGQSRLPGKYFFPRNKVKVLPQQTTSSLQETPMKPSQVPNRLSHLLPKRMLQLQSPELCHKERPGPLRHLPQTPAPIHSSGIPVKDKQHRISSSQALIPEHFNHSSHKRCREPEDLDSSVKKVRLQLTSSSSPQTQKSACGKSLNSLASQTSRHSSDLDLSPKTTNGRQHTEPASGHSCLEQSSPFKHRQLSCKSSVPRGRLSEQPSLGAKQAYIDATHTDIVRLMMIKSPSKPHEARIHKNSEGKNERDNPKSLSSSEVLHNGSSHSVELHSQKPIPAGQSKPDLAGKTLSKVNQVQESRIWCRTTPKVSTVQNSGSVQHNKTTRLRKLPIILDNIADLFTPDPVTYVVKPVHKKTMSTIDKGKDKLPTCETSCSSSTRTTSNSHCTSSPCLKAQDSARNCSSHAGKTSFSPAVEPEMSMPSVSLHRIKPENLPSLHSKGKDNGLKNSPNSSSGSQVKGDSVTPPGKHKSFIIPKTVEPCALETDTAIPEQSSTPHSSVSKLPNKQANKESEQQVKLVEHSDEELDPDLSDEVDLDLTQNSQSSEEKGKDKLPTCETSCSSSTRTTSISHCASSPCLKAQDSARNCSSHAGKTNFSPAVEPEMSMPSVSLHRIKPENLLFLHSKGKDNGLKNSPNSSSGSQVKGDSVTPPGKHKSFIIPKTVEPCALETDTAIPEQSSTPHSSVSKLPNKQANKESEQQVKLVEHSDEELDLDLSFEVDLDVTQNSQSSEEEQLLSFHEMMERFTKPPKTPEKGDFSEPSTPGNPSCKSKPPPVLSIRKPGVYKNNLDQMLKEINTNKRVKELEAELLTACDAARLIISECEETDENREESISTEHQQFLKRYLLQSSGFSEVPPGEMVFNLENFGRIFNQHTLQLRQCTLTPQTTAQKTLMWSSPAQLRLYVNIDLFQEAYNSRFPCPAQVTRFLFRMMSVHDERLVSAKILRILCDIACVAACQIVKNGSQEFKVWVPSLADVTLVLMNMGVSFVTLFPFEDMQPPFTEADLLDYVIVKSESPSSNKEQRTLPRHNCNNIFKYLAYCMGLCPKAFSDEELLLFLTVTSRVGLDTRLILGSSETLCLLQLEIVKNIRDWDTMLPRICLALTDLTDDHHNMCHLVQQLPDNKRGKQLRRHLSLSMISKLLDGTCIYRPTGKELQLSDLRRYLPRMKPSSLHQSLLSSTIKTKTEKDDDVTTLDQQAYYLCYSLLTLTNEATRFKLFPANQKEQLDFLCAELEAYIKSDIRESEKCLYRSKVKDLEARIYTKWQAVLTRTRPLHHKLCHYWQPRNRLTGTQEQTTDSRNDSDAVFKEKPEMEDEEKTTNGNEDSEFVMDGVEVRGEAEKQRNWEENAEQLEQDNRVDDANEEIEDSNRAGAL